jgi:aspartokinase
MFVALVDRSTISIVIGRDHVEEVSSLLGSTGQQVKISVEEGVSIVALTAKRYKVSQVADAVRSADVDMINIFKAPSNITICVVVDSSQTDVTVRALHALL